MSICYICLLLWMGVLGLGHHRAGLNPTSGAEAFPHTECQSILVCAERILLD